MSPPDPRRHRRHDERPRSTSSRATCRSATAASPRLAPNLDRRTHDRVDRRARRLRAPRLHPDAHSSLPDAVPRLRRRSAADGLAAHARVADGSGAHARIAARGRAARRPPSCSCSGTTAVLTMETVHDTDVVFEAVAESGMRATIGKCMMDFDAAGAASGCRRRRGASIDESVAIRTRWDGAANGRLRAAFAPRFAVSCSRELLEAVASLSAAASRARAHARVGIARGDRDRPAACPAALTNIEYLASVHLASPHLCAAHCVWVDDREQQLLAEHDVKVMHCPGSNLKLGSGIAPVPEMRARGITVSLGADGAACNNRLDMFEEMRLAAVLQAMRRGPGALPARDVALDGDARGRADARARARDRIARGRQARRPHRRRSRPPAPGAGPGSRTRRSSTPPAAATCGRRSSTASCWWTSSRRCGSIARRSRSRRAPRRASSPRAPAV